MQYSDFTPLALDDKPTIDRFFREYPPEISELTFTNLFIWKDTYHPAWAIHEECLCLVAHPESPKEFFYPPVGPNARAATMDLHALVHATGGNFRMERVPEELARALQDVDEPDFHVEDDRDNADYLYSYEKLLSLSGGALKSKRKLYRRFLRKYPTHTYKPCRDVDVADCKKIERAWYNENATAAEPGLRNEYKAVMAAMDFHDELDFEGGAIFVGEDPVALTFGEGLNPDTIVVHVEKANTDYDGAYQAISRMFLENSQCCQDREFVNREQDLGIPGLRRAKKSYDPIRLVKKWMVTT